VRKMPRILDRLVCCLLPGLVGLAFPQFVSAQATSPTARSEQYYNLPSVFTSPHIGPAINLQFLGIATNLIVWNPTVTTLTTCTLQVEISSDGLNWSVASGGGPFTCTTNGNQVIGSTANFLRINVTALSGGNLNVIFQSKAIATGNLVQGTTTAGSPGTSTNPVLIGGLGNDSNVRYVRVCTSSSGTGCSGGPGQAIAIGAEGNTTSSVLNDGSVTTADSTGNPLATYDTYADSTSPTGTTATPSVSNGGANSGLTQNTKGLFSANLGFWKTNSGSSVTANSTQAFLVPPGAATLSSCMVAVQITNNSGTSPTLNVYFQTSIDNVTWTDRISFTQATTGTSNQIAGISEGGGGLSPTAYTDGTLAAGSKVDGPIGLYSRIKFVVGGTSPNYTVTDGVICH
jgi:hypothetical protein